MFFSQVKSEEFPKIEQLFEKRKNKLDECVKGVEIKKKLKDSSTNTSLSTKKVYISQTAAD